MQNKRPGSVKDLLVSLVRIPSVNQFITGKNDAEHDIAVYIKECAVSFGLNARFMNVPDVGNNLLITKEFRKGAPWLMFASHMDTVSSEGMDIEPFSAEERNGRIYGRGSCDDKSGIAAALWALKEISAVGGPNNIAILLTVDEEQHRNGAAAFAKNHLPALDFRPFGIIVAEPTSLKPVVAHAGISHFMVNTKGKSTHASDPSKGRSAIKDMVTVMDALETEYINQLTAVDTLCGKAQCSINMIQGGRQVNAIPDLCTIRVDRRIMPGEDVEGVLPAVENILKKLRRIDPRLEVSAQSEFKDEPLSQDINNVFINWTLQAVKDNGFDSAPIGAQFATDAGAFSQAGLPCVVIGPGEVAQAHTSKESIGVDELESGTKLFKSFMLREFIAI
jgi:acetylornithine deacetylase